MRKPASPFVLARFAAAAALVALLGACASGGDSLPQPAGDGSLPVPDGAVASVHTEDNGDVVTEYRVQGQLRMVKVVPARGPVYYLVDSDGDGRMDPAKGETPTTWFKLFSF